MKRIKWTYQAKEDLRLVETYIYDRNPKAAWKIVSKIYEQIRTLKIYPFTGRTGKLDGTREFIIAPYIIVYRITEDYIQILRIFHGARDWP